MHLLHRVARRLRRLRSTGWGRSFRIAVGRTGLNSFRRVYGFDARHSDAPLSGRPFRRVVAEMINALQPTVHCVVEVGYGVGSILSLQKAPDRNRYDLDSDAIRAARFLNGPGARLKIGGMDAVSERRIDVLILVGWTHEIEPEKLAQWSEPLLPRTAHLLVDGIDSQLTEYRFRHDFAFLAGRARHMGVARAPGEARSFLLFQVLR